MGLKQRLLKLERNKGKTVHVGYLERVESGLWALNVNGKITHYNNEIEGIYSFNKAYEGTLIVDDI